MMLSRRFVVERSIIAKCALIALMRAIDIWKMKKREKKENDTSHFSSPLPFNG